MGSIKVITDGGILPGDPDRNGIRRIDPSGISDSDHSRNRVIAEQELKAMGTGKSGFFPVPPVNEE